MSPRPIRLRKVSNPPIISGFKPYGNKNSGNNAESVFLHYEEYEALRLCDYEMLNHHKASVIMDVSRPTLTRIYARARQKIAEALVKGSQIIIEGGKIYFDSEWFSCKACGCYFNNPDKQEAVKECPLCKSSNFSIYEHAGDDPEESLTQCSDICICPSCGYEQPHQLGKRCNQEICPNCSKNMVRKGTPHSRKRSF
jgi:predicted DNA-binding protein (UPF0251 family)